MPQEMSASMWQKSKNNFMKNKLVKLIALLGLSINVASAEAPKVDGKMEVLERLIYLEISSLIKAPLQTPQIIMN
jgi:hypothetical protein